MADVAMKHMASNFTKLDKFERVDFRRWQKKMHFVLSSMSVVYVLTTPMPEDGGNDATVEQIRKGAKWDNDDYVCKGLILSGMSDYLFDTYQNVESSKELWDSLEAKYMAEDASSKKFLVSNFTNYKMTDSRPVLEQYNELLDFKHTLKHLKEELTLVELGSHLRITESLRMQDSDKPKGNNVAGPSVVNMDDDVAWWVDSRAIVHVCKDRCWSKTYESLNDGSILHMGNESTTLVHRRGYVDLKFSSGKIVSLFNVLHVPNIRKNLVSSSVLNNCGYKQVTESNKFILSKHGVFIGFGYLSNQMFMLNIVNDNIASAFMSTSKLNDPILWHVRLGHVHFKRMQDMFKDGLILAFDMDTEKCKTCMLNKITKKPFQNVKRKTKVLELVHSDLCDLHATPSLGNKKYFVTFIDDASRTESRVLRVWGSRAVVRLPNPKLKTLGERGIDCIFIGHADHSKGFRFYVIEPNDSVSINSIIESRDAIFDENRFSSVPRPSLRIPNGTEDIGGSVVPEEVTKEVVQQPEPELRKGKRNRNPKNFRPEFQLYLIKRTMDEVFDQHSYCFNVEDDPKIFNEAMKSQDVAFWKEAINDEMDSIMDNNTWVLADLPPGCKPLGCKWIFKRKLKVDGTIEKFKARLAIQGFKQKSRIDYFDTYALVARISTIILLITMTLIHNLIIYQMDVKTAFLNGDLEEEVYMNQPQGFIMPGNENKVCKLIKSLYGLKQAPKQWHQKFDEVVLSNGYLLNQADKCVYSKFDESGKGVIICLYVDDMLIFGTDQVQVDLTKEFLSSKFSMKDMGEADVILGIRIKHGSNGIAISQSHYIEKVLKKFNYFDCTPVSTPMDTSEKLMPNNGQAVSQLEYSRVFLLGSGAISWASKKQTCITGSTMEYEFVALAAAVLLHSQMYNGKSRHLGVRHSMICELITNEVISIEFVRSQQNLADHLMKGLARDLVIKSVEGMSLQSN
ncbi:zinc finger, CCHC-type containing protein [Tanacetum coccineum]